MRWLRGLGWMIGALVLLFVAITAVGGFAAWQSSSLGDLYVERSKNDMTGAGCLNKGKCNLAEGAPIATLAEYRRCGEIVAGTRIRGEPLGCSEQGVTDLWLRDWFTPGQAAYRQLAAVAASITFAIATAKRHTGSNGASVIASFWPRACGNAG